MSDSNRDLAGARQRHSDAMARDLEEARARARNSELELAKKEAALGQHGREVRARARCCEARARRDGRPRQRVCVAALALYACGCQDAAALRKRAAGAGQEGGRREAARAQGVKAWWISAVF